MSPRKLGKISSRFDGCIFFQMAWFASSCRSREPTKQEEKSETTVNTMLWPFVVFFWGAEKRVTLEKRTC